MIITCPNCKKQFRINSSLIPADGRDLKCGSCDHTWFYKNEDKKIKPLPLNEDIVDNSDLSIIFEKKINQTIETKQSSSIKKIDDKEDNNYIEIPAKPIPLTNKAKKNTSGKFFSYIVVSIISFVALIILIDTLKTPLINIFPRLEIVLFSLFEILKDIKLFIIDLY
mgnify:CR=1 FL=1|tara:strand:- start:189 stop:689 length:501 start_codon:yes stop_codon:yes gene_type:complete